MPFEAGTWGSGRLAPSSEVVGDALWRERRRILEALMGRRRMPYGMDSVGP